MEAVGRDDVVAGRQHAAVDDEQDVWRRGRSSAPNRGRSLRSGGSRVASSSSEVETIRIGPTASDCWALWPCGSHFTQSQWVRFCSG